MRDNKNILDNCYVVVIVDRLGNIEEKKFIEFKTDKEAIEYVKEKNQYKKREESVNVYFAYKIKKAEIL